MNAAERIARALGGAQRQGRDWRCQCPLHGGCRLTLRDGRRALLVRYWAGCETRNVLAELHRMGLLARRFSGVSRTSTPVVSDDRGDTTRRTAVARCIWDGAREVRGSPVVRYPVGRRIITASLRWAASPRPLTAPASRRSSRARRG
jgi:hypothetical protein